MEKILDLKEIRSEAMKEENIGAFCNDFLRTHYNGTNYSKLSHELFPLYVMYVCGKDIHFASDTVVPKEYEKAANELFYYILDKKSGIFDPDMSECLEKFSEISSTFKVGDKNYCPVYFTVNKSIVDILIGYPIINVTEHLTQAYSNDEEFGRFYDEPDKYTFRNIIRPQYNPESFCGHLKGMMRAFFTTDKGAFREHAYTRMIDANGNELGNYFDYLKEAYRKYIVSGGHFVTIDEKKFMLPEYYICSKVNETTAYMNPMFETFTMVVEKYYSSFKNRNFIDNPVHQQLKGNPNPDSKEIAYEIEDYTSHFLDSDFYKAVDDFVEACEKLASQEISEYDYNSLAMRNTLIADNMYCLYKEFENFVYKSIITNINYDADHSLETAIILYSDESCKKNLSCAQKDLFITLYKMIIENNDGEANLEKEIAICKEIAKLAMICLYKCNKRVCEIAERHRSRPVE